jgi:hypothetical protein
VLGAGELGDDVVDVLIALAAVDVSAGGVG